MQIKLLKCFGLISSLRHRFHKTFQKIRPVVIAYWVSCTSHVISTITILPEACSQFSPVKRSVQTQRYFLLVYPVARPMVKTRITGAKVLMENIQILKSHIKLFTLLRSYKIEKVLFRSLEPIDNFSKIQAFFPSRLGFFWNFRFIGANTHIYIS